MAPPGGIVVALSQPKWGNSRGPGKVGNSQHRGVQKQNTLPL